MAEQTFNKAVGEVIALRFIGDWATSDDDGIRIKPDIESGDCTQILSWTPACEMEGWPDAPDALTHPSLPYPFNAKELAAFLLAGVGALVGEYYGDFSDGPDEDGLRALGIKAGHAREALRQAYAEIRRAIEQVGEFDQQLQQKASHLRSQFADVNDEANTREGIWEPGISDEEYRVRRARASQSVKELEVEMESVCRSADSALKHWNASMVKALLYPTHELTDSAAPPEAVLMPAQAPAMTKAGLVRAHMHRWTTIESDLSDAARNGLSEAKAGERGWVESKALEWARAKGKLADHPGASIQQSFTDPMIAHYGQLAGLQRLKHTL